MSSENDLSKVSGSAAMAKPKAPAGANQNSTQSGQSSSALPTAPNEPGAAPKKKRHRAGKNRKKRRQSFIAPSETEGTDVGGERPSLLDMSNPRSSAQQASFYRLNQSARSNTSLESEALLDHRDQGMPSSRRRSNTQGFGRPSIPFSRQQHRSSQASGVGSAQKPRFNNRQQGAAISEGEDEGQESNDRTPLLSRPTNASRPGTSRTHSGHNYGSSNGAHRTRRGSGRRSSGQSKSSFKQKIDIGSHGISKNNEEDSDFDVNNPPSMPGSPRLGSLDDVMKPDLPTSFSDRGRDAIIDIDYDEGESSSQDGTRRRQTVADMAERDVCFPVDGGISEMGDEEEEEDRRTHDSSRRSRRRRAKQWPDLEVLDEFSREEKEERTQAEYIRSKKISEPVMVGGRLRPRKSVWHREEDDAPFRFTYFSEKLDGTIHARNISDLCQDGGSFRDLFKPEPEEVSDSSDDDDDDNNGMERPSMMGTNGRANSVMGTKAPASGLEAAFNRSESGSKPVTGENTPSGPMSQAPTPVPQKPRASKRYGPRPTFWLDVLKPTEIEMKVLAKTFGIHQLTIEDILMDEPREKVELFQSYYFVNYRSFEQDKEDEDYMEPINMYVVVFRDGVITFHHSMTPHPANVRRRVRQLNDYMSPTADWVSYAIIDDVTDVYAPLVQQIEEEVDDIDDEILYMHQASADVAVQKEKKNKTIEKKGGQGPNTQGDMGALKAQGEKTAGESGGDMLRRVGECRKKVMGLYRLLGNKADVIKGFAKRCNEHWDVAPRSEIGLYLGDIQDHIVTMTGNLSHYESLLSRAHSNYLAQINIRMNERAEQTSDILGKLTVLGTIVLPMNIVTGMWGMNVWVPGQGDEENLTWFWCITAGLLTFGLGCYFIAKRQYGIV